MEHLQGIDIISGREGKIIATVDGRQRVCAEIKSLRAKADKEKKEFRVLGYRGKVHKALGWGGTGTVSYYVVTSLWAKMMADYAKTGIDVYFDILVVNEDPASGAGRQSVLLKHCNIDGADVAVIDVDADSIEGTFNFTFDDYEIVDEYNEFPYR